MFFGIFVLNRVSNLSFFVLNMVKCLKQGIKNRNSVLNRVGKSAIFVLNSITSCRGFKLACININGLCKHIDEIRYILINSPLEMLAINESKLDGTISDTEVYIPGYIIIRKDRSRSGGGVAFYIRENLSYTNRIDLVPDTLEIICVEINLPHSRSFLVSTWYRPPSAEMQLFDEYEKFIQRCDIEHKQLILMGDIN